MQMIAEAAGASKETLYRHFESKEFLFAEIVSRKARLISGPDGAIARGGSPEVVLSALGTSLLLTTVCTGQGAFLFRTVVGEAARSPELGDLFYDRGPGLTVERLTQYLADATKRGELHCDDPAVAARLLSWRGGRTIPSATPVAIEMEAADGERDRASRQGGGLDVPERIRPAADRRQTVAVRPVTRLAQNSLSPRAGKGQKPY